MKLVHFSVENKKYIGLLETSTMQIQPFKLEDSQVKDGVLSLINDSAVASKLPDLMAVKFAYNDVQILAPLPQPKRNIFCVGKNYLDHISEIANSGIGSGAVNPVTQAPEYPIVFSKVPHSVIGHNKPILRHRQITNCLDYEAELAVVIGREGRAINEAEAMDYVFGYTIINDISARDLQKQHQQWLIAKSLDSFCPMGPVLVTKDEIINIDNVAIKCWVNDELRQNGNTRQFIFDIPKIIATISAGITLYPGDIIATGTPSGVGAGFVPPKFLDVGDRIKIAIEGIGELVNFVAE